MNIVTVIPLARGIPKENLDYFTIKNIPVGTIVSIPLRKKIIDGIVVNTENISQRKGVIKVSNFKLKRLESIKGTSFLPAPFWQAISKAKDYFATTSGALIYSVLPQILWEVLDNINLPKPEPVETSNLKLEKLVLQTSLENRLDFYKKIIRQNFARKKSVFLCVPTIYDLEYFSKVLEKGISEFVHIIETDLPKKKFTKKLNDIFNTDHPILIIGTPIHLYLTTLIRSIDTIIIEKESSEAYRTLSRPFVDMRIFAEILATQSDNKIIFADTMLRIETIYRVQNKELNELVPISFHIDNEVSKEIVNLKSQWRPVRQGLRVAPNVIDGQKKKFFVLSNELKELIKSNIENKKHLFIFSLRKGLASLTICNDCHTILSCDHCNAPFTLYKTASDERIFICNKCKNKKKADVKCSVCGGWNLVPLGIGIETIKDELKEGFDKAIIFKLDKESVKSHKQAENIIDKFYSTPGSILIGTEMAFYYLKSKVDFVSLVSFDSLYSIPSFRINEKIIKILINLEELAQDKILIQTKNPDEFILKEWYGNNLAQFYRQEIEDRERFFYPPFSTIIKITYQGSKENVEKEKNNMLEIFKEYNPSIFFGFVSKMKQNLIIQIVIRIQKNKWAFRDNLMVDEKLLAKLSSLSPSFTIQIDPESTI